ncbi:hypothetical protein ElyMa_004755500 [Elysia marginata]|uniref:Uncharacterized protein n=1 Tax=Elysia marginata TaxID=1093978 RepID=A0AAV4IH11_9GAST|nr:hypothetical protein ElyMa_004755500 [Elysia marginata]
MHLHTAEQKALQQIYDEEKEEMRREREAEVDQSHELFRRHGEINLVELVHEKQEKIIEEDKMPKFLSKMYLEENLSDALNKKQHLQGNGNSTELFVGTGSRKRRLLEKFSRVLAQQKKSKRPCRICAQTFDRVISETALGTIESVLPHCDVRSACIHHSLSHCPDTWPTRLSSNSTMLDTRWISC